MIGPAEVSALDRCLTDGGVAIFPADTVYGLACDPGRHEAIRRLYEIKGRAPERPAAIMYFDTAVGLTALGEQGPRTRALLARLLPGGVTVLLPNPRRRFPLACGPDPLTLGLRVPALAESLAALGALHVPVLQTSANPSGGADARRLEDVPEEIRGAVDMVLDGGELLGTPSTVVDLRRFETAGEWGILRAGAVPQEEVAAAVEAVS